MESTCLHPWDDTTHIHLLQPCFSKFGFKKGGLILRYFSLWDMCSQVQVLSLLHFPRQPFDQHIIPLTCLYTCIYIHVSICLTDGVSTSLTVYLSIHPSVCPSAIYLPFSHLDSCLIYLINLIYSIYKPMDLPVLRCTDSIKPVI
jgi:hypothetical protein